MTKERMIKSRYARSPGGITGLTGPQWELLGWLAQMRFLSLPQLARLLRPQETWKAVPGREVPAHQCARRHLRTLFDAGLVDVLAVSRAALAPAGAANDSSLLFGSAPNVYAPTLKGLRLLCEAGRAEREVLRRPVPSYGPKNGLFLAHELLVRDVRVWLEVCSHHHNSHHHNSHHHNSHHHNPNYHNPNHHGKNHSLLEWRDGADAIIPLGEGWEVRPDAWFVYQVSASPKRVLVGLVEVDRGTERGDRRWGEKLDQYGALLARRKALMATTGYVNARVLVFTPDARRRDTLADLIAREGREIAPCVWLATLSTLAGADLTASVWRTPWESGLRPLLKRVKELK